MTEQNQQLVNLDSAAVVDTSLLAFGAGMSVQDRVDVKNSYLLANLVANKRANASRPDEIWFTYFLEVMQDCGWTRIHYSYDREEASQQSMKLSNVALAAVRTAAASLAGGATAAAVLGTVASDALQRLAKDETALAFFKRNVQERKSATVGLGVCRQLDSGEVILAMGALQSMARTSDMDVLFFDWDASTTTTYKAIAAWVFNRSLYKDRREEVESKLANHAKAKIAAYEI